MLKKITLIVALCSVYLSSHGQSQNDSPFLLESAYIGDSYYNTMGGRKQGGGYIGMVNIKVGFDTEKAGWFNGGTFFINGANVHGKSLSKNYLSDLQVASNIDADEQTYLHELWYRQSFGKLSFTFGLQDLNTDFMVSEGAGEFLNSSFGVPPVVAMGVPIPIFPFTGMGLTVLWDINENWAIQGAFFDGEQHDFEENPYNINWGFSRSDGLLTMGEVHFKGRYKLGAYYHSAYDNYGFYAMIDQPLNKRVGLFAQLATAPKSKNDNHYSIGLGLNFNIADNHTAGVAFTHAGLHKTKHYHETAIELYYKYKLSDNITLQPDVQYIINPSDTDDTPFPDALVVLMRLNINF